MAAGEANDGVPTVLFLCVEDWVLEDPAGQGVEEVRPIRDEIRVRVRELLQSLDVATDGR